MKKKSNNAVIQYLKFIVVGSINAIVNYVAYAAVVFVGGHYVLATLVGFVLSVLSSYLINSRLVFERDEGVKGWQVLLRLYIVYAFSGLFLTTLLTWLFLDVLNLEESVRSLGEGLTFLPTEDGANMHVLDYDKLIGLYVHHYKVDV